MTDIAFTLHSELKGRYKLKVIREDGSIRLETDWFENLIVNQGLDQIGGLYGSPLGAPFGAAFLNTICSVGTGTTTPTNTDTQLTSFGAATVPASNATSGVFGGTTAYVAGPPSYWSCIWTYTFNAGVATGTWSEIGVGNYYNNSDTQPHLFSHALIVDGSGNPTTITVLSSESLIATYELDYYINTTTNSYSFVINTTTYSGNYLRANVATPPSLFYSNTYPSGLSTAPQLGVFNGTIGPITGQPSGTSAGFGNATNGLYTPYISGNYYNTFYSTMAISQGNVSGGITAIMISNSSHGSWQFSVSPAIPKTSSYQLTILYNISWARYP